MKYVLAVERPENGGWSDWVTPSRVEADTGKLRHACCDCGLVHDVEVRASQMPHQSVKIQMRFKRNRRATHMTRVNDRKGAILSEADKVRQGKSCSCKGTDDMCPCQNVRGKS